MDFIQNLKGLFGFVAFLSTFIYRGRISRQADNSNYHGCTIMATPKAIFSLEGLVYKNGGAYSDPVYIYKGASINSNDLWDDLWDQFMESEETITAAARIEKWRESLNQEEILKETRLESIFELAKKFPVSHDLAIHEDFLTAEGEEIFPDCQTRHDLIEKLRWAGADELCKVIATARIGQGETYNDSLNKKFIMNF